MESPHRQKVKLSCQAMKAHKKRRVIPPLIRNLGIRRMWMVDFTLRWSYSRKKHRYPSNENQCETLGRAARLGRQQNIYIFYILYV